MADDDSDSLVYFATRKIGVLSTKDDNSISCYLANETRLSLLCREIGLDMFHVTRRLVILVEPRQYIGYWDDDRIVMIHTLYQLRAYLMRVFHAAPRHSRRFR